MSSVLFQYIILLLLAHLCGDYLLQTAWLAKHKRKSVWVLALHSLINAAAAYLLLGVWGAWLVPLVILVSHFLIDFARSKMKKDSLGLFLLDQALHLIVSGVLIIYVLLPKGIPSFWFATFPSAARLAAVFGCALILLTFAGGILIGYLVKPFHDQIREYYRKIKKEAVEGLIDGGKWIGWLERLLIFVFILANQYAGVGFLIAAKSIFRFGELKESENRKEAEYIIIGTFASFLFAIAVSLAVKWVLESGISN